MSSLKSLDLSNNQIGGSIPENLGNDKRDFSLLILRGNHIEGSIPNSLCKMEGSNVLDLSNNRLSGTIPNCWRGFFFILNLSSNKLSGTISSLFGNYFGVGWLNLSNNSLHGEPFQNLQRTQIAFHTLDLSRNQFSGTIPSWIGQSQTFQDLTVLKLSHNLFSGDIPLSLCQLPSLQVLDLAGNNFSGLIPPCVCHLEGMIKQLPDDNNSTLAPGPAYFSIAPEPADIASVKDHYAEVGQPISDDLEEGIKQVLKGLEHDYTKNLKYLKNIDLSNNSLRGLIPEGLTCLSGLIGLNLSHNKFSGEIPSKIGRMISLESIDLSSNQLFGPIPSNILTLTSLSYLNLSNNNFSGRIPQGAQFSTFDSSSYGGNQYLCGDPLSKACPGDGITKPSTSVGDEEKSVNKEEEKEKVLFYSVVALGFITGFWGVIGILLIMRNWRYACFQCVENFADTMYVAIVTRVARLTRMINKIQDGH